MGPSSLDTFTLNISVKLASLAFLNIRVISSDMCTLFISVICLGPSALDTTYRIFNTVCNVKQSDNNST